MSALQARVRAVQLGDSAWPALGLVVSLACLAPLLVIAGADVGAGYSALFDASFGSAFGFGVMATFAVPLILAGLAVAVPYRAGLFNIGAEGQLIVGAFVAVLVGTKVAGLAGLPASWVLLLAGGFAGGAAVGAIAGALRAWRGINEIITTIMLNFVALLFVEYWVTGPLKDPDLTFASSRAIDPGFETSHLGITARIPTTIFVAVAVALIVGWLTHYTRAGWRQRMLGANPAYAARAGIPVRRMQFLALLVGGGLAGIAGAAEVVGNQLRVGQEFSPGWGFDAIAIALLARGNAIAVIPFAAFFAFLRNGSGTLQTDLDVPGAIIGTLAGAPVIVVAGIIGYRAWKAQRAG
jgi:simple sugar transport system permease protein